jgi:hypothetical protein
MASELDRPGEVDRTRELQVTPWGNIPEILEEVPLGVLAFAD